MECVEKNHHWSGLEDHHGFECKNCGAVSLFFKVSDYVHKSVIGNNLEDALEKRQAIEDERDNPKPTD